MTTDNDDNHYIEKPGVINEVIVRRILDVLNAAIDADLQLAGDFEAILESGATEDDCYAAGKRTYRRARLAERAEGGKALHNSICWALIRMMGWQRRLVERAFPEVSYQTVLDSAPMTSDFFDRFYGREDVPEDAAADDAAIAQQLRQWRP
jgi:hypothetical protein